VAIKLVVFDVDGTLTLHSSIWWRLHEEFNTQEEGKKYFDLFFDDKITYQEWADYDAGLWKGQPLDRVLQVVEETELVTGARETIKKLKEHGIQVAVLSGGLDILANHIARCVGIDYVLTNRLLSENGILTGGVEVKVGWGEKVQEIRQINEHFGVSLKDTAFVGDGRNDLSVFQEVGLSIAFRPEDEEVADSAMVVVQDEDLRDVLPHIIPEIYQD
jgi:phosphoserine phosphatase